MRPGCAAALLLPGLRSVSGPHRHHGGPSSTSVQLRTSPAKHFTSKHSAALHRSRVQWSGCSRTHLVGEPGRDLEPSFFFDSLGLRLRLPFSRLAFSFCLGGSAPSTPEPPRSEPSSAIARCVSVLNSSGACSSAFAALSLAPLFCWRSAVREQAFASCSSLAWRASAAHSSCVRVGCSLRRF